MRRSRGTDVQLIMPVWQFSVSMAVAVAWYVLQIVEILENALKHAW